MKDKIKTVLETLRPELESKAMCYMALNGGFEFEIKNKLAFLLQENYHENEKTFFVKEAKVKNLNNSKIVDIIGIQPQEEIEKQDLYYLDGKGIKNKISCFIEIGHNYLSQSPEFSINKTRKDIGACKSLGINDNLYIIQIVTYIPKTSDKSYKFFKRSYFKGVEKYIGINDPKKFLKTIKDYYFSIDPLFAEITFKNQWNDNESLINCFIVKPQKL